MREIDEAAADAVEGGSTQEYLCGMGIGIGWGLGGIGGALIGYAIAC